MVLENAQVTPLLAGEAASGHLSVFQYHFSKDLRYLLAKGTLLNQDSSAKIKQNQRKSKKSQKGQGDSGSPTINDGCCEKEALHFALCAFACTHRAQKSVPQGTDCRKATKCRMANRRMANCRMANKRRRTAACRTAPKTRAPDSSSPRVGPWTRWRLISPN
jgi:hypothetical protein